MTQITREEFKAIVKRIYAEAGADVTDGSNWCNGRGCHTSCPFSGDKFCIVDDKSVDQLFNTFEFVEQWAKDHPILTNAEKYKEVFGVEPKDVFGEFMCPRYAGFLTVECKGVRCKECKDKFWNAEYKEPAKEEVSE